MIREIINKNRIYAWMVIFIILVHAYALWKSDKKQLPKEHPRLTRQEFRQQIEARQKALEELIRKDPSLAVNLGYITMFLLALLVTGGFFLLDYMTKKKRGGFEPIPRTLDAPSPLWNTGDVFKILILFIFFNYLFSIFAHLLDKFFHVGIIDRRADIVASTGFLDLLSMMFIFRFVVVKYRQHIDTLGISFKKIWSNIKVALYSYIGFLPILVFLLLFVVYIAKALNYTPEPEPIYELVFEEKRRYLLIIISFLVSIVGPVAEEIFFRGFLYSALRKRLKMFWAMALSALFFSFLHTNVIGFVPILMLGIFLAYLREKTGSLIPSITVHVIHNTALASVMFLVRELTSKI